jgi:hypothetical protein
MVRYDPIYPWKFCRNCGRNRVHRVYDSAEKIGFKESTCMGCWLVSHYKEVQNETEQESDDSV